MDLLPSPGPHDTTTHLYSLEALQTYRPVCWINANAATNRSDSSKLQQHLQELPLQKHHLTQAIERWERLRPVLAHLFPLEAPNGRIQSPLRSTSTAFQEMLGLPSSCTLFIKEDSKLAVCGSVKARGGLYETLAFAETINDDWILDEESKISLLDAIQEGLMEDYQVVVGSTGNLGLSVGLVAAAMGMKSTIHMSKDAKQWKKDLLRERG
jgi:D-serine dehydratase